MTVNRKRFAAWMLILTLLPAIFSGCGKKEDSYVPSISTHPQIPTVLRATVTSRELNVHSEMGYDAPVVSTLEKDETVTILECKEWEGVSWGRTEAGWICLLYASIEEVPVTQVTETQPPTTELPAKNYLYEATIIVEELNIRSGPSAKTEKTGKYYWHDMVRIMEEKDGWGRTDLGWISLNYTYASDHPDNINETMRVRASSLNVRKGPSTTYEALQELVRDDEVTILKTGTFGGNTWGYNGTGWLSMDYLVPIG